VSRRELARILGSLAGQVLSDLKPRGERDYVFRDDYHVFDFDRHGAIDRFECLAPAALSEVVNLIPATVDEYFGQIAARDIASLESIREGGWVLAYQNDMTADLRLSGKSREFLVAAPGFSIVQNLDAVPLNLLIYPIRTSFELDDRIDLGSAQPVSLRQGDHVVVDGFKQIIAYEKPGVLVAVVATLPLGAYESIYLLPSGQRAGVFSSDVRVSAITVALRVLAAAGWTGAEALAGDYRRSAIKEIRWDVMNYAWRANLPSLGSLLAEYQDDDVPQIRDIARSCLAQLNGVSA
jgi:hypothetical protein